MTTTPETTDRIVYSSEAETRREPRFTCPAYDVIDFPGSRRMMNADDENRDEYVPIVKAGDRIGVKFPTTRYGDMYVEFRAGSVVSYALEYSEDPIDAYNRAVRRGHKTHWLNASAVSVVSGHRDRWTMFHLEVGKTIYMEGRYFRVALEGPRHLKLEELDV